MNECLFSVLILPRKHRRYQNRQFCGSWGRCLAGEVELGTDLKDKWKKWSSLKFFECLPCCQLLCLFQVPQQAREGLNAGLARGEDGRIFFAFFLFLFAVRTTFKNPTFSLRESFKLLGLVKQPPQLSSATWCPFNTVLAMCLKVKTTFVEGQRLLEMPLSESRKWGMSLYYPAAKNTGEENWAQLQALICSFCSRPMSRSQMAVEFWSALGSAFWVAGALWFASLPLDAQPASTLLSQNASCSAGIYSSGICKSSWGWEQLSSSFCEPAFALLWCCWAQCPPPSNLSPSTRLKFHSRERIRLNSKWAVLSFYLVSFPFNDLKNANNALKRRHCFTSWKCPFPFIYLL